MSAGHIKLSGNPKVLISDVNSSIVLAPPPTVQLKGPGVTKHGPQRPRRAPPGGSPGNTSPAPRREPERETQQPVAYCWCKKSHRTVNGVFKHWAAACTDTSVGSDSDDGIVSETADHIKRCSPLPSCQHTASYIYPPNRPDLNYNLVLGMKINPKWDSRLGRFCVFTFQMDAKSAGNDVRYSEEGILLQEIITHL